MSKRGRGRPPHDDTLTPTEWRIAHAVQHGMSNRQIAERRGISRDGVKYHVANILAKLGLRDRKELRHWFQAPKESALRGRQEDIVTAVSLGPLGQISRTVGDLQRAEQWYGEVLGLKHLYTFGKLAFYDCGGTRLMLTQETTPGSESILYFRVDDIERAHSQLQGRGVEFMTAPHMIHRHADGTEEWLAAFKDCDGRPLALISQARR